MRYLKLILISFVIFIVYAGCKKDADNTNNRALNNLEEKILGTWIFSDASGYTQTGYWVFKSNIIDSLSTPTETFRELEQRIVGQGCPVNAKWYITADSILTGTCVNPAKILLLTNDSLIFRYTQYGVNLDYRWHR